MVAAQCAACLHSLDHFLQVLGTADAVFFADIKQRAFPRQVGGDGGLFFLGGQVAGRRARGQTIRAFGLIDAQPLAHRRDADADAFRRRLAAGLASQYFFHDYKFLLWRKFRCLGHGNRLSEVVGADCRKASLVKGRCRA